MGGLHLQKDIRKRAAHTFYEITGIEQFHVSTHLGVGAPAIHFHVEPEVVDRYPGGRPALQAAARRVADTIVAHYRLVEEVHINDPGVSIIVSYPGRQE